MSVSANTHVRFIQKCLKASSIQVKAKLGLTYIAVVEFLSEVLFFVCMDHTSIARVNQKGVYLLILTYIYLLESGANCLITFFNVDH